MTDSSREVAVRKAALTGLAQTLEGAQFLVGVAKAEKFPADLRFTAMTELNNLRWANLKAEGAKLMPLPSTQNAQPLPSVAELVKLKGDATKGAQVFRRVEVGCINCHQVNGEGMDFGPRLSEIGTKLGKDAIYESILDPSAGISFGFEAWQFELKNGDEPFGIVASETADEVAVKTQNGITSKYKKSEIVKRDKMATSIMPTGLQLTMSQTDLVDLVEYLTTLKKAAH